VCWGYNGWGEVTPPASVNGNSGTAVAIAAGASHTLAIAAPDADGDGVPDASDSCPSTANPDQADADADADGGGVGDACDNWRFTANPSQSDRGGMGPDSFPDGIGDACQCGDEEHEGSRGRR
jgi:hypothetical protein